MSPSAWAAKAKGTEEYISNPDVGSQGQGNRRIPFFKMMPTSGFEMYFGPSTFGAGGPYQNLSRIQHKEV